jgi:hypothetical protein
MKGPAASLTRDPDIEFGIADFSVDLFLEAQQAWRLVGGLGEQGQGSKQKAAGDLHGWNLIETSVGRSEEAEPTNRTWEIKE